MGFTPITTQEDLDEIIKKRVDHERRYTRKWERRAKRHRAQLDTARRALEYALDVIDEMEIDE